MSADETLTHHPIGTSRVEALYNKVTSHIDRAKNNIQRTVNSEMVRSYWLIGRDLVEEQQAGQERAEYGKALLKQLSQKLQRQYSRGFGIDTLEHARKFYLTYQSDTDPSIQYRS